MSKEVIIVTGLSGAGKSTALHVFEDMRHFTADGVPPVLVSEMVRLLVDPAMPQYDGIALGLDQRRKGFAEDVASACRHLVGLGLKPIVLYLEADPAVLMRRYATTRRPHPLERQGVGLEQAIFSEMERLAPLRDTADMLFDTTSFSLHDLRRHIQHRWNAANSQDSRTLKVHLLSFGFKHGTPREADLVFDLRFLPNPYFVESLRPLSGKDKPVVDHIFAETPAQDFRQRFLDFLMYILPLYESEGRYRLTIAIGCTGGRHRSVAMAEATAKTLQGHRYEVTLEHRHIDLG